MECKFCHTTFSSKSNLNAHQKNSKYCLKIQGKEHKIFPCISCGKNFPTKANLNRHVKNCSAIKTENKFNELNSRIISLESENKTLKSLGFNNSWYKEYFELQNAYRDLVNKYVRNSQDKISLLNKKYVKRQPRTKYEGNNFIYIVTTPSLKQERCYILGKAVDLTNRLSTYNKTDEHEVIYYCCCPCKSTMGIVENLVFNKLGNYRERANRERFILPEDQNIILFSEVIKKCVNFVKESL